MDDVTALTRFIFETLRDDLLAADEAFTPDSDLIDAGLDSLAATQLLLALEERTGVWVDESVLTPENLASSSALARCVHGHLIDRRGSTAAGRQSP